MLIGHEKQVSFEVTKNKYAKNGNESQFVAGGLFFERDGTLSQHLTSNQHKDEKYTRVVNGLREARDLINFDDGIIVNLEQVP